MREIIQEVNEWREANQPISLATVVKTWGSAPRKAGAKMALTASGTMAGSVSGGCVEGAVVEAGQVTLETQQAQLLAFGVADETAWTVGLACGGKIDVFVEPFNPQVQQIVSSWVAEEKAGAVATIIQGPEEQVGQKLVLTKDAVLFDTLSPSLKAAVTRESQTALKDRRHRRIQLPDTAIEIFVDVIMPAPTVVIVGGVHIAQGLIPIAKTLGFQPIVIDPRRAFGSAERFPAMPLYAEWPRKAFPKITINEATAIVLLTHDPKIDDQALAFALPSAAFYIGALGSSKTAAKRRARLEEAGYTAAQIGRIHGPVGLNINSKTPEEIALSIMAELISIYRS
ncbi:MAG: XdhC family protein [Candidatus Promineifilaceae bacterium]